MRRRTPEVLVLALDIGTSSTRTALFDDHSKLVAGSAAQRKYSVHYTADGGAELSPEVLLRAARTCFRKTLDAHRSLPLKKIPITAVAGSAFWHGLLGLDRRNRPLTPVFTWADSRCVRETAALRTKFDERKIHAQTGCMLRASFWPAKLLWLRRTDRRLFNKVSRWVSPPDWIFAEIFGNRGTSESMASATGLYDRRTRNWHSALCAACGVHRKKLDAISSTDADIISRGELTGTRAFRPIGDGAAGNVGCGADRNGSVAINIGTSAAVRVMQRRDDKVRVPFGLFRYVVDGERDVIGGAVSNAGNLRCWCAQQLRLGRDEEKALNRKAAASDTVAVLPFWVAERAPTWPENLRGVMVDLTQATDSAEIFRATTCATFYRLGKILDLIEGGARPAGETILSGGILRSAASVKLLADALGRDVAISANAEASLRGAAVHALEQLGYSIKREPARRVVRHDRALAEKHRRRRERQAALENLMGG
jgi:gluconokinase